MNASGGALLSRTATCENREVAPCRAEKRSWIYGQCGKLVGNRSPVKPHECQKLDHEEASVKYDLHYVRIAPPAWMLNPIFLPATRYSCAARAR